MALSQKHHGKIFVPWFNSKEWRMVYELIYSENSTRSEKIHALNILRIWKVRMPLLFAGVEGTLIILEALLLDESTLPERVVCSLFATAVMRFLNICAANSDRQGTFYQTAKRKNLPDWLINIRHDLAHSQKMPSRFMLNLSLKYCLDWLKNMYWDLQNDVIEDCVIKAPNPEVKLEDVVNIYCDLKLTSAGDKDTYELYATMRKLGIDVEDTMSELEVRAELLDFINKQKFPNNMAMVDVIVKNGGIFQISDDLIRKGKYNHMPKEILWKWEVMLQYLQVDGALIILIRKFYDITNDKSAENKIREMSAVWLSEIFKGLFKENLIQSKLSDMEFISIKTRGSIRAAIEKRKPRLSNCLNFLKYDPNLMKQLDAFKNIVIGTPTVYSEIFIKNLLQVCSCPMNFIADVELAMKSYLHVNELLPLENQKLYSPDDVEEFYDKEFIEELDVVRGDELTKMEVECNNGTTGSEVISALNKRRWQKVEDTSAFDGCPLGILPHQDRNINPVLNTVLLKII